MMKNQQKGHGLSLLKGFAPLGVFWHNFRKGNFIKKEENHNGEEPIKKSFAGFTLVELLVVMFIIILLSSSVLASYWNGEKNYAVSRVTQQLVSDLRRAQNMALSGATHSGVAPGGYGLYFESAGQYSLFFNTNESKVYEGSSVKVESIVLPVGTTLSPAGASIFFVPPEPITFINGVNSGFQAFTVENSRYSHGVTVYSTGLIDF